MILAKCPKCQGPIPAPEDMTDSVELAKRGELNVTCPNEGCGFEGKLLAEDQALIVENLSPPFTP
jgi:hypothetical protein